MKRGMKLALIAALALAITIPLTAISIAKLGGQAAVELKEAKLIIEHNATDNDTGFQAFFDSEGWQTLEVSGPNGQILSFKTEGDLSRLGLTELFFETVEPANADVTIEEVLAFLPEGDYTIAGSGMEAGEATGEIEGTARLTHDIPAGPELLTPGEGATVDADGAVMSWAPVTETIDGGPVTIIAYQLIVEEDVEPGPHMIGKFGLSVYVPPDVTSVTLPPELLKPGTTYAWEVLAIEESGNQTLSSSSFETE